MLRLGTESEFVGCFGGNCCSQYCCFELIKLVSVVIMKNSDIVNFARINLRGK